MAIISPFPGLVVEVIVNGAPLKEYDLPADSEGPTNNSSIIKYIEATPGAKFAVRVALDRSFKYTKQEIHCDVKVDGNNNLRRGVILLREGLGPERSSTLRGVKLAVGRQVVRQSFVFSALMKDDRPVTDSDRAHVKDLGQIVVKVNRVKTLGCSFLKSYSQQNLKEINPVPEKALKGRALSRKTKLGAARPSRAGYTTKLDWIDPRHEPFALFTFRYRSMDDLYAEMIVAPPLSLEERDVDTLTVQELRELTRRQRERLRTQEEQVTKARREIKREHGSDLGESSSATKRRRIETIDLTED